MQSKILMLNEILYAKYENEVSGKSVTFPPREKDFRQKIRVLFWGWKMERICIYFLQRIFTCAAGGRKRSRCAGKLV